MAMEPTKQPATQHALYCLLHYPSLTASELATKLWPDHKWGPGKASGGPGPDEVAVNFFMGRLRQHGWVARLRERTTKWGITEAGKAYLEKYLDSGGYWVPSSSLEEGSWDHDAS